MHMQPKTYIFFGNVGAGKGTQVELLKKVLEEKGGHVIHISPGAEYRKIIAEGTHTGELVRDVFNRGALLPEFLTTGVFVGAFLHTLRSDTCLITDGFPRSEVQSAILLSTLEFYNRPLAEIIYIEVSKEEAVRRMKLRARSDDTDASIAERFSVYEHSVLPAMHYLAEKGCTLHTINGEQSMESVHADILRAIGC